MLVFYAPMFSQDMFQFFELYSSIKYLVKTKVGKNQTVPPETISTHCFTAVFFKRDSESIW